MKRLAALLFGSLAGLAALTALGSAGPARAYQPPSNYDSLGRDWGAQQNDARQGVRQGRYIALAKVISEIKRRTPGYQLDAGLEQAQGRAVYRVRWAASSGRRIDYIVDASSGAILSER